MWACERCSNLEDWVGAEASLEERRRQASSVQRRRERKRAKSSNTVAWPLINIKKCSVSDSASASSSSRAAVTFDSFVAFDV